MNAILRMTVQPALFSHVNQCDHHRTVPCKLPLPFQLRPQLSMQLTKPISIHPTNAESIPTTFSTESSAISFAVYNEYNIYIS